MTSICNFSIKRFVLALGLGLAGLTWAAPSAQAAASSSTATGALPNISIEVCEGETVKELEACTHFVTVGDDAFTTHEFQMRVEEYGFPNRDVVLHVAEAQVAGFYGSAICAWLFRYANDLIMQMRAVEDLQDDLEGRDDEYAEGMRVQLDTLHRQLVDALLSVEHMISKFKCVG